MILDFFPNLPIRKRPAIRPSGEERALAQRQAEKISELRANGFHALARWFSENPERVG